jgi:hypothetical protein
MLFAMTGIFSILRGVLSQDRGASVRALGISESEWGACRPPFAILPRDYVITVVLIL